MSHVVKLTSHTGIAASIPYLLGFHPAESLVVIGLDDNRLSFTMRIDLPPEAVVDDVMRRLAGYDAVLVAVYTTADAPGDLPCRSLVDLLIVELDVREALLVCGDRVWSYLCANTACCPPEGKPFRDGTDADSVAAAHILRGRRPLSTREELLAAVETQDAEAQAAVTAALPAARAAADRLTHEQKIAALTRLLASTLTELEDPRRQLTPEAAAQCLALIEDVEVRDLLLQRLASTEDPAARRLVDALVRQSPDGHDAEVCAAKAFLAYLDGDGVTARAAAERVLTSQPAHRLAALVLAAVERGVNPGHLRALRES